MATNLRHSISTIFSSDSLTPKTTPRIKQHVASYHTTKAIAHQRPQSQFRQIASQNWLPWQSPSAPLDSHLTHDSLGPIQAHNPNGISIVSAVLAQLTVACPYTLQWDAPFPLQIAPSHGGDFDSSNTWFPGPTRVHNPNSTSISSAVFAGLTSVTDRLTDHATQSVTTGRIYVRSTAMQPNNNKWSK